MSSVAYENKKKGNKYVIDSLGLKELANKFDAKWQKELIKSYDSEFSGLWRYNSYYQLFYSLFLKKMEYTTTSFNLSRLTNGAQYNANYAFLFSVFQDGKLIPEYICLDGTYVSADGEFRHRFIPFKQFMHVYKNNLETFHPFEKYLLGIAESGRISIKSVTRFSSTTKFKKGGFEFKKDKTPMNMEQAKKYVNKYLKESRIPIIAYTISFMIETYRKIINLNSIHMTPGYEPSLYDKEDIKYVESLGDEMLAKVRDILSYISTLHAEPDLNKVQKSWVGVGQKITPLRVKELARIEDVRYPIWREIYINKLVGNLVFNNITFGVPYSVGYFLIHGNDKDLYDNKTSQAKLDHSHAAEEAVKMLEYAKRFTFARDELSNDKVYHNYRFSEFDDEISVPVDYAQRNLIMSDYCACSVTELVGRTFGDVSNILLNPGYAETTGPVFRDFNCFSKYLFEWIYTFYCLNSKIGVIHTDPHANNVTLFSRLKIPQSEFVVHKILYKLENKFYIFTHYGKYGVVIDFSRSILNDDAIAKLCAEYPGKYSKLDIQEIKKKQNKIIKQRYKSSLPEFYSQHSADIKYALEKIPEIVFKLFTVYDAFHLVQSLKILITSSVLNSTEKLSKIANKQLIEKDIFGLLDLVKNTAQEYLTKHLIAAVKLIDTPEKITVPDYPLANIIHEVFKRYELGSQSDPGNVKYMLVDYFDSTRKIELDCNDESTFPEFMLLKVKEEGIGKYYEHVWKEKTKYYKDGIPGENLDALADKTDAEISFNRKYSKAEDDKKLVKEMEKLSSLKLRKDKSEMFIDEEKKHFETMSKYEYTD